jgi:cytidyltransferase-like protein
MNLGEYLANILLEQGQSKIAIFPGAFKPPHKGHFEVVKLLSQQADEVIVLISPKSRDGISAEESFEIWESLYKPLLDENVSFKIAASNPVTETYDVIKNNPENKFIVAFGKDEGDRFNQIKNSGKYTNVSVFNAGSFEGLSATGLRNALKTNEDITPYIPEGVDVDAYKSILNITPPLNESPPIEFEQDEYQDYILKQRDKIEKAAAYFNLPIPDMEYAFNAGRPVILNDDSWMKLENANSFNIMDLEHAIRYAHGKGIKIKPYIDAIRNGEELPLPLVLNYSQDKYYLVAGDVILSLYRALKIPPTVLQATLNLSINENKIQKKSQIAEFVKFAVNELGIKNIPTVKFSYDTNESRERSTFGYFDPNANHIWIYIKNRNTADILRTLAHELVHRKQEEDGRLDIKSGETGSPIEDEANATAGVLLRNFGKINSGIYEGLKKKPINELSFDLNKGYKFQNRSKTRYTFNTGQTEYEVIFIPGTEDTYEFVFRPLQEKTTSTGGKISVPILGDKLTNEFETIRVYATTFNVLLDFLKNNKDWKEVVISPILKYKTITTKSGEEKIITSSARQAITRGFMDVVKKLEDSNYFEVNEDEFGVFHIYRKTK